jgi:hypothetical protein
MQLGVFDLVRAREQQIQTAVAYIETLLDHWLAHTELEHLLSGRLPSLNGMTMSRMARPQTMRDNAGH